MGDCLTLSMLSAKNAIKAKGIGMSKSKFAVILKFTVYLFNVDDYSETRGYGLHQTKAVFGLNNGRMRAR